MPGGNGHVQPGQGPPDSRRRDECRGATNQVEGTTPNCQARPSVIGHVRRPGKSTDVKAKGRGNSNTLATEAVRVAGRVFGSLDELPGFAVRPLNVSRNRPISHTLESRQHVDARSPATGGGSHCYYPGELNLSCRTRLSRGYWWNAWAEIPEQLRITSSLDAKASAHWTQGCCWFSPWS